MSKRLGNFLILAGLLSLVVFFTSKTFFLDAAWFFLGGVGLTTLGLLLKRAGRNSRSLRRRKKRRDRSDLEGGNEFD
jgi:hypothetical protein